MEKENKKRSTKGTKVKETGIQYFAAGLFLGCVITGLYYSYKENKDKWGVTIINKNKT